MIRVTKYCWQSMLLSFVTVFKSSGITSLLYCQAQSINFVSTLKRYCLIYLCVGLQWNNCTSSSTEHFHITHTFHNIQININVEDVLMMFTLRLLLQTCFDLLKSSKLNLFQRGKFCWWVFCTVCLLLWCELDLIWMWRSLCIFIIAVILSLALGNFLYQVAYFTAVIQTMLQSLVMQWDNK